MLDRRCFSLLVAGSLLAGCASAPTTLDAQWVDPQAQGQHGVRSLMVMSSVRDATTRRLFEDRMAAALNGAGVKALQSYKFIPEEGPVAEDRLRSVLAQAGVTHAMVSRVTGVTTQINATPGTMIGPAWGPGILAVPGYAGADKRKTERTGRKV